MGAACTREVRGWRAEGRRLGLWLRRAKEQRCPNGREQRAPLFELEINEKKYPAEKARGSPGRAGQLDRETSD